MLHDIPSPPPPPPPPAPSSCSSSPSSSCGLLPFASIPCPCPPRFSYLRPPPPPPPPSSSSSSSCSAPGPSLRRPRLSYVITPGLSLALPLSFPSPPLSHHHTPSSPPCLSSYSVCSSCLFIPIHVFLMCLRVAAVAAARSRRAPSRR